jgi:hypothetical protein
MEAKIAFILVILIITGVSFFGFINQWPWQKIVKRIIIISAITTPLVLIDNYRLFIIAFLIALIFECKNLMKK